MSKEFFTEQDKEKRQSMIGKPEAFLHVDTLTDYLLEGLRRSYISGDREVTSEIEARQIIIEGTTDAEYERKLLGIGTFKLSNTPVFDPSNYINLAGVSEELFEELARQVEDRAQEKIGAEHTIGVSYSKDTEHRDACYDSCELDIVKRSLTMKVISI